MHQGRLTRTSAQAAEIAQFLIGAHTKRQDALYGFLGAAYALHTPAAVSVMADGRDLQKAVGSGDAAYFATQDQRGRGQWRKCGGEIGKPRA